VRTSSRSYASVLIASKFYKMTCYPVCSRNRGRGLRLKASARSCIKSSGPRRKNSLTWKEYASHGSSAQLKCPGRNQAEEAPDEQIGKLFRRLQGQNVIEGYKDKPIT